MRKQLSGVCCRTTVPVSSTCQSWQNGVGTILGRVTSFIFEAKLFFVPRGTFCALWRTEQHSWPPLTTASCTRPFSIHQVWQPKMSLGVRACMHAKSLQLCPTLFDPLDRSPLGASVHGILQARILEWVAISSSRGSSRSRDRTRVSYISCTGRQGLYH